MTWFLGKDAFAARADLGAQKIAAAIHQCEKECDILFLPERSRVGLERIVEDRVVVFPAK